LRRLLERANPPPAKPVIQPRRDTPIISGGVLTGGKPHLTNAEWRALQTGHPTDVELQLQPSPAEPKPKGPFKEPKDPHKYSYKAPPPDPAVMQRETLQALNAAIQRQAARVAHLSENPSANRIALANAIHEQERLSTDRNQCLLQLTQRSSDSGNFRDHPIGRITSDEILEEVLRQAMDFIRNRPLAHGLSQHAPLENEPRLSFSIPVQSRDYERSYLENLQRHASNVQNLNILIRESHYRAPNAIRIHPEYLRRVRAREVMRWNHYQMLLMTTLKRHSARPAIVAPLLKIARAIYDSDFVTQEVLST